MDLGPLILTPLEIEARAIAAQLDGRTRVEVIGLRASRLSQLDLSGTILLAGLAGALDPTLKAGDVVVDELSDFEIHLPGVRSGRIQTAASLVATPREKADLCQKTGALAVEMESDVVRTAAKLKQLPMIHVRAISDAADEGIDPELIGLISESGKTSMSAVASLLIRRPTSLKQLMQLGSRSSLALRNLASAVREIVNELSV